MQWGNDLISAAEFTCAQDLKFSLDFQDTLNFQPLQESFLVGLSLVSVVFFSYTIN